MERSELPSFNPSSIADGDLGLTLSPGSQSQLSASWLQGQCPLSFDLGLDQGFNPFTDFAFTDFGQLVHMEQSNKRTTDEAFLVDSDPPSPKRQCLERQELPVQAVLNTSPENAASIPSHTTGANLPRSASASVLQRFSLDSNDAAHLSTLEATVYSKSNPQRLSPYGPTEYQPSAPSLHLGKAEVEVPNEASQNRLQSYKRRIDVLTAERNRYRDGVLKYTKVDPKTGKLGIHLQEAELATLRRVNSTQQQRARQFKAEIEQWKAKYAKLANTHNSLIRDYQHLQQWFTASRPTTNTYSQDSNMNISYPSPASPRSLSSDMPIDRTTDLSANPSNRPPNAAFTQFSTTPSPDLSEDLLIPLSTDTSTVDSATMTTTASTLGASTTPAAVNPSPRNHSPSAPPKSVGVIDLTTDGGDGGDDDGAGAATVSSRGPSTAQERSPLTDFRRNFRKKELKWLQHGNDHDIATDPFRGGSIRFDMGACYQLLETQKQVRRNLGGPFAPSSPSPNNRFICLSADDELAWPSESELWGDNDCHPADDLAQVTDDELEQDYHPTDDDLARLMEEELAGSA